MEIDPIVAAWPSLSEPVQRAILLMVDLATAGNGQLRGKLSGYVTAAEIAAHHGLNVRVVRKHLREWRKRNYDGFNCKDAPKKARGPKHVYLIDAVEWLIEKMKTSAGPSSGPSGKILRRKSA